MRTPSPIHTGAWIVQPSPQTALSNTLFSGCQILQFFPGFIFHRLQSFTEPVLGLEAKHSLCLAAIEHEAVRIDRSLFLDCYRAGVAEYFAYHAACGFRRHFFTRTDIIDLPPLVPMGGKGGKIGASHVRNVGEIVALLPTVQNRLKSAIDSLHEPADESVHSFLVSVQVRVAQDDPRCVRTTDIKFS